MSPHSSFCLPPFFQMLDSFDPIAYEDFIGHLVAKYLKANKVAMGLPSELTISENFEYLETERPLLLVICKAVKLPNPEEIDATVLIQLETQGSSNAETGAITPPDPVVDAGYNATVRRYLTNKAVWQPWLQALPDDDVQDWRLRGLLPRITAGALDWEPDKVGRIRSTTLEYKFRISPVSLAPA